MSSLFSSRRAFSCRASDTFSTPYLAFHLSNVAALTACFPQTFAVGTPFEMQAAGTNCDLLVLRLPRELVGSGAGHQGIGIQQRAGAPMVRLLRTYALEVFSAGAEGAQLKQIAERLLLELVSALCLEPAELDESGAASLDDARVAAIREQISCSSRDPCLSMRKVVSRLGFSDRLGQLILRRRGLSFSELLRHHRLDRAHERLAYPGERVVDVAFAVAFSDLSHFHRLYKARFGHTPAESRETIRIRPIPARSDQ